MMTNDLKMMNDMELDNVTGGNDLMYDKIRRDLDRLKQQEAARQEAIRRAEEARLAEAANQSSIHAHGGGVSGGW